MAKEEEDLAIDFSKIGRSISSIFKSKGQPKERHASHAPSPEKHHQEGEGKDEEITIDIKGAWNFIVKHKTLFILLIPLFITIFFRTYPFYLPVTDDWARSSVDNYYRNQIMGQVSQQYPNLPPENKEAIANENLQKLKQEQKDMYNQQVSQVSQTFKNHFKDETGQTYILDIDPWQWYRYTKNIVEHGYPGDYIRSDGVMIDNHMVAPIGNRVGKELHPYIGAYLHRFLAFFKSDISVMTSFFLLPVVLSVFMAIGAFFVGRKIGGDLGGFFASIIVVTSPSLLARTTAGVPDTDVYTILFPLFIMWLFFEAIDAENRKHAVVYSVLSGIVVALFSMAWYGWWYIFDFIVGTTCIYLAYRVAIRKESIMDLVDIRKESKKNIIFLSLLCLFATSAILVTLFSTTSSFSSIYTQPILFITIKESANPTLWPNVFTTVAELNEASFTQIIGSIGGKFIFAVSILGILLTLTLKKDGKRELKYAIILSIWFLATLYASTKGIRFVNLLIPAFAIAIGAAVGISFNYLSKWFSKELNLSKAITNIVLVLIMLMLLIGPIKTAEATARNQVPLINDAWYNALTKIKTDSPKNAIVNSWWDFGHWFKAVTDRAVTFDGASQNRPQAHWVGHVLLTDNEDQAVGILRMLDCGATLGYDTVNNATGNMHRAVDIVYEIIVLDKEEARKVLEKNIPAAQQDKIDVILNYTHCNPPDDYFITSEDMVGKAGVWAHFGSWDFERAKIWRELRKKSLDEAVAIMKKEFNYSDEKAQNLYYEVQSITDEKEGNNWISPWPGYAGMASCPLANNDTIQCVFNIGNQMIPIQVRTKTMEAFIETNSGNMYPASISYIDGKNNFVHKKYANNTIPYSITLIKEGDGYSGIMESSELAASMFTRMFYLNGTGLKHFDFFTKETDISGLDVIVWKVDWEGKK